SAGAPSDNFKPVACAADELAYLISTSGSTGKPKLVEVPHRQIMNRLAWMWRTYPFQPDDICCQRAGAGFVDSVWEVLGPLLKGVPTVIIPDSALRDPDRLIAVLAKHRITRMWIVPALLRNLLLAADNIGETLPCLRFWVST